MFYSFFLLLIVAFKITAADTSYRYERYLSILETFATFKKYVCNYGAPKQYHPHLLFDLSITSMTATRDQCITQITFDTRRKIWQKKALSWLAIYEPAKKFDGNLCYDCSLHHATGQAEWISRLTRTGGDLATLSSTHNESYDLYEELVIYGGRPRPVKAHTRVCDQSFVHDGRTLLAYVSWTPLLHNFRTNRYTCINHPPVPEVSIYLKPSISGSLKEYVLNATKEKIKQHIHLSQSYNTSLINELVSAYNQDKYPSIDSKIPYITFKIFAQQKILPFIKYTTHEQTTEEIAMGDFLKYPRRNYPEYETKLIEEDKQSFVQHFVQNAQSYHIETFDSNSLNNFINNLDSPDNYALHGLYEIGSSIPVGAMLVHLNQEVIKNGIREKRDFIELSIYPKETSPVRIFDNYAYRFLNTINKWALWHLYKSTYTQHSSIEPTEYKYESGKCPTNNENVKNLFTYLM